MKPLLDFGFIQIPTFYLIISLTATFVLLLIHKQTENYRVNDRKFIFDLVIIIMIAGFLGARIFHIIYEELDFYMTFPLEMFKFWKGGFVYFGGFITALFCSFIFITHRKQNFWTWADFLTPYVGLSYAFGRIGCFFEGCCYGQFCELPWAIQHKHPTQLYMFFAEVLLLIFLIKFKTWALLNKGYFYSRIFKFEGSFFLFWLFGHGLNRFIIEFWRNDDRGALLLDHSISQWFSFCFIILSLIIYLFKFRKLYSN